MGKKKNKKKQLKKLEEQEQIVEEVVDAAPALEAAETADDLGDALREAPMVPELFATVSAHEHHAEHEHHGHKHAHGEGHGAGHKYAHEEAHDAEGACAHAHGDAHHGHHHDEPEAKITFAVITCSDTRSMKEDTAGAALETLIAERGWTCAEHVVVKDDRPTIGATIAKLADIPTVDVVLTCGGSGLSLRDVTPEATGDVCERDVPGIAEGMRAYSMRITPRAMLSRARCMQRGTTLVINLPGSEKAARENWEAIAGVLPHAVSMMAGGGHPENDAATGTAPKAEATAPAPGTEAKGATPAKEDSASEAEASASAAEVSTPDVEAPATKVSQEAQA